MNKWVALALLLAAAPAAAQERQLDWNPSTDVYTARYAADLSEGLSNSGAGEGRVSESRLDVFYQRREAITDQFTAVLGAGYRRTDLFLSGGAPLPDALQSLSLRLGGEWKFDERWSAGASVSPGVYGDTDLDRAGDFKVPVSLFARYVQHPGLVWLGGFAVGFYGRRGATPFIGVIWQIDERWRLNATPPMARLSYRLAKLAHGPLELFLGFGYDGGRYQVGPSLGDRVGHPELANNTLSVQQADLRAGASAGWRRLRAEAGAGYEFARRFVYEQAGETYDLSSAPYLFADLYARF